MIMGETDCEGNTQNDVRKMNTAIKLNLKKKSLNEALATIPQNLKPVIRQTTDKGASSWLNALLLKNQDFYLNKEDFRDALRLRYGFYLESDFNHAFRYFFTVLLNKVCINVKNEPRLLPVTKTKETVQYRTANIEDGTRLDIKASGFWRRGQTEFF